MSSTDVMEVQALLNKLGYDAGQIDGIFGLRTQRAVKQFQRNFGLLPDGIIGANTWRVLERFLLGYDTYTIRPGDTLYAIAQRFFTSLALLEIANPGIDPTTCASGRRLSCRMI